MGRVEGDAFIEITLTAVLAYFAFILAEEVFHMSGVMATVAAGMVIGGWGKTKISPSVAHQLEQFWEYLAQVANAIVFLMVGLMVDLGAFFAFWHYLVCAILAMVISRAVVVYSLVPLVGRLPGTDPIDRGYQTVMFWGGLRGAIALAIALQLPDFPQRDLLVAIAMGAVLFTILLRLTNIEGKQLSFAFLTANLTLLVIAAMLFWFVGMSAKWYPGLDDTLASQYRRPTRQYSYARVNAAGRRHVSSRPYRLSAAV